MHRHGSEDHAVGNSLLEAWFVRDTPADVSSMLARCHRSAELMVLQ